HDISVAERLRDPYTEEPSLYFYDTCPGGSGLAEGFLKKLPLILQAASNLVRSCNCKEGCPSCIGPVSAKGQELVKGEVSKFLLTWLNSTMDATGDTI
ncbi:MAG: ATP-dependent helicase, partial [Bacteroidetes bacterium]